VREAWILDRGQSAESSRILQEVKGVDVFMHGSLRTRRHMTWESDGVQPFLDARAVILADDVGGNTAFSDWASSACPRLSLTLHEPAEGGIAGIAAL
jgi:hypothetical protein